MCNLRLISDTYASAQLTSDLTLTFDKSSSSEKSIISECDRRVPVCMLASRKLQFWWKNKRNTNTLNMQLH